MPARIIFAYDGPDIETTKKNLIEHQQAAGIQPEDMVNLIVVNNKYHISKVGYGGYQEPGQPFQAWGTMQFYIGSLITPQFDKYYRQIKISAEKMDH